jgi:Domain of unknown function (DUF4129)
MKSFSPIRLNPWREIAILMIILMEVSWITPWFRSLTPQTYAVEAPRVYIVLSLIIFLSHLLIRIMDYLHIKKSIRQGLMIVLLIIGSFIGIKTLLYAHESVSLSELINRPLHSFADLRFIIPVEFIVIITVLIGFWRGVSLAQEHIGPSSVMGHFWFGIVMFVTFTLLITFVTGENAGDFFYIFLFSSLVGIGSARMAVTGMVRGGKENKFNRSWFLGIVLASLLVVMISSFFSDIVVDKFPWIGELFSGLFGSLIILLWLIISPVVTLLISLLEHIFQNSNLINSINESLQNLSKLMDMFGKNISDRIGQTQIGKFISEWGPLIRSVIFVSIIVVIILVIILWMAFKLWSDRERRLTGNEEKMNIKDRNLLQSILNIFLQGWKRTMDSLDQLTNVKQRKRIRAAARVRQVYAELLELCEDLGHPRQYAQTPLEFVPELEHIFPDLSGEIDTITQAYVDVRYGLIPETQNEINDIEVAWKKLRSSGNEQLTTIKHRKK